MISRVGEGDDAAGLIRDLAEQHHLTYNRLPTDVLGQNITRLSGDDDVILDETELILLALERAGHLPGIDSVRLHAAYLRQRANR